MTSERSVSTQSVPLVVEDVAEAIAIADCGTWRSLESSARERYLRLAAAAVAAVDGDRLMLTLDDAAATVSLSRKTLERRVASGELEVVRVGGSVRVVRAELEAWVELQRQPSLLAPRRARRRNGTSSSVSLADRLRSAGG